MSESKFATVINCMDGRVQLPSINWMREQFDVPYIDSVTEAGPNKILIDGSEAEIESIKTRVLISTEQHGSNVIATIGHHNCAGNPAEKEQKCEEIKKAVEVIKSWNTADTVIGLYVNENWEVEKVI